MLYAQKMWSFLLPQLLAGEAAAAPAGGAGGAGGARGAQGARAPFLLAFAALLPLVPASLYLSDLRKVRAAGEPAGLADGSA